jgi:hypothetical protein
MNNSVSLGQALWLVISEAVRNQVVSLLAPLRNHCMLATVYTGFQTAWQALPLRGCGTSLWWLFARVGCIIEVDTMRLMPLALHGQPPSRRQHTVQTAAAS